MSYRRSAQATCCRCHKQKKVYNSVRLLYHILQLKRKEKVLIAFRLAKTKSHNRFKRRPNPSHMVMVLMPKKAGSMAKRK